jgi:cytochrome P450
VAHDSDITGPSPRRYPFSLSRSRLDPDPQYAELRRTEPVCRVQLPYGPPAWLVTDYHLARLVFGDARFSRAATVDRDNPREGPVDVGQVAESVMSMDPPEHTRIRQLVGRAFTARRVEQLRPRAQEIASGLVDGMAAAGPPADLVESFSFAFPAIIICELLGIPDADRHTFRRWADATVSTITSPREQMQDAYVHLAGYLAGLFAQRRARPEDDLLTSLVQARDRADRLTETELLFLGMAVLVGGYETTAHQITNMVYTLLTHGGRAGCRSRGLFPWFRARACPLCRASSGRQRPVGHSASRPGRRPARAIGCSGYRCPGRSTTATVIRVTAAFPSRSPTRA